MAVSTSPIDIKTLRNQNILFCKIFYYYAYKPILDRSNILDLTMNSCSHHHGLSIRTDNVSIGLTGCSLVPGEGSSGPAVQPIPVPIYIYIYIYPKVYFTWVPEVGTSRGYEPITDQSCGAIIFLPLVELIEIYPPATFPELYNRSETQFCPKYWPT